MTSNQEVKEKAKKLLFDVKNSKLVTKDKNILSKNIFDSFNFLRDYHDEYLDFQYKIIPSGGNFTEIGFGEEKKLFYYHFLPIKSTFKSLKPS